MVDMGNPVLYTPYRLVLYGVRVRGGGAETKDLLLQKYVNGITGQFLRKKLGK